MGVQCSLWVMLDDDSRLVDCRRKGLDLETVKKGARRCIVRMKGIVDAHLADAFK